MSIIGPYIGVPVKNLFLSADFFQKLQSLKNPALHALFPGPLSGQIPAEGSPMDIAGILAFVRIFLIGIIIDLTDLIPAVNHGNPRLKQHIGVKHEVHADGVIHLFLILLKTGAFNAAHRGGGAAEPGVPGHRVVIVQFSPAPAAREFSGIIVVEEPLVGHFIHSLPLQERKIQPPADIVMTAEIVQEGVFPGKPADRIQLFFQQRGVLHRQGVPDGSHSGYIVQHMALRFFYSPEVGRHFLGFHNHFPKQNRGGTYDFSDHAHHPHNGVYLPQIPAGRPQLLPYIGDGVNADDIHAQIGKKQEIVHHLVEDSGVGVVQIPLIGIKGGHHIIAHILQIGKVSRSRSGKYLGHRFFKLPGNLRIVIEEIAAHVLALSGPGPPGPLVIFGSMIHDKIHTDVYALFMAFFREAGQIFHGSQILPDFTEIRHSVPAVRFTFCHIQKGHQVNAVHVAGFQIGKPALHTPDGSGKIINIEHHAQHIFFPEPFRVRFLPGVSLFQSSAALLIKPVHLTAEFKKHIVIAVKLHVQPPEFIVMTPQPFFEI